MSTCHFRGLRANSSFWRSMRAASRSRHEAHVSTKAKVPTSSPRSASRRCARRAPCGFRLVYLRQKKTSTVLWMRSKLFLRGTGDWKCSIFLKKYIQGSLCEPKPSPRYSICPYAKVIAERTTRPRSKKIDFIYFEWYDISITCKYYATTFQQFYRQSPRSDQTSA